MKQLHPDVIRAKIDDELETVRIVWKNKSWLMKLIAFILWPINRKFLTGYTTSFAGTIFFVSKKDFQHLYDQWPARLYATVMHEKQHLQDEKRFLYVFFWLTYLLLPLPLFFTGRAFWEARGYKASLCAYYEATGYTSIFEIQRITDIFKSSSYGWMWITKWPIDNYFNKVIEEQNN